MAPIKIHSDYGLWPEKLIIPSHLVFIRFLIHIIPKRRVVISLVFCCIFLGSLWKLRIVIIIILLKLWGNKSETGTQPLMVSSLPFFPSFSLPHTPKPQKNVRAYSSWNTTHPVRFLFSTLLPRRFSLSLPFCAPNTSYVHLFSAYYISYILLRTWFYLCLLTTLLDKVWGNFG